MTLLLEQSSIDEPVAAFLRRQGRVFAVFDHRTQGSGNISYGVWTLGGSFLVKTAGHPGRPPDDAPIPYFDLDGRNRLLRAAIEISASCDHPALAPLRNVLEAPHGPALVYDWAPGELLHVPRNDRTDPDSAYRRFAHLPADRMLGVLDALMDLHRGLAAAGWVAADLYDGCLLVHMDTGRLTVIDLDTYRRGPGTNTMGRMFGDTRYMAPEEFVLGAPIDQRTTVFTLARLAWHFGTRLTEDAETFIGGNDLAAVVRRGCRPDRSDRYGSVAAFAADWVRARSGP